MNQVDKMSDHPFADLYARIPKVACTGQCGRDRNNTCCGPIACTVIEAERLEQFDGQACGWTALTETEVAMTLPPERGLICPHLGLGGSCTAYEARPIICRVWGAVRAMPCPWGCQPERWMTDREVAGLLAEASRRTMVEARNRETGVDKLGAGC